jgi:hypothetical protein
MGDFAKDITGIVTLLIGAAILALLVGHAAGASTLITSSSSSLNTLLGTVELNGSGSSNTSSVGSIDIAGLASSIGAI